MQNDDLFMREALRLAAKAREANEVPVGAVVVLEGRGRVGGRDVLHGVPGPTLTRPCRIAALNDEARHDPMEARAVEETLAHQRSERGGRAR